MIVFCHEDDYVERYRPYDSFEDRWKCHKIYRRVLPDGTCKFAERKEK